MLSYLVVAIGLDDSRALTAIPAESIETAREIGRKTVISGARVFIFKSTEEISFTPSFSYLSLS